MPQEQLDNVLAAIREQHIKGASDTKVLNAMAKKQGSVGEDKEAVAVASLAAEEAGEVAAGSSCTGRLLSALQLQERQSKMLSGTQMQV